MFVNAHSSISLTIATQAFALQWDRRLNFGLKNNAAPARSCSVEIMVIAALDNRPNERCMHAHIPGSGARTLAWKIHLAVRAQANYSRCLTRAGEDENVSRVCLTLAVSLLLGGATVAADPLTLAPGSSTPSTAEGQRFDWSGFHAGFYGGYVSADTSTELDSVDGLLLEADVVNGALPDSVSGRSSGALFGVQAGYDQQFGSFVLGVEGDIAWANAGGSSEFRAIDPGTPYAPVFAGQETVTSFQTNLNNLTTARLRAGVTTDRTLFYVTGGLAAGHVDNEFQIGVPGLGLGFGPWSDEGLLLGYTAGVGMEYAVSDNVSAKLELLHYDLSDRKVRATDAAFPGQQITYRFLNSGGLVRAGLNFRF